MQTLSNFSIMVFEDADDLIEIVEIIGKGFDMLLHIND